MNTRYISLNKSYLLTLVLSSVLVTLLFASCQKPDDRELNKGNIPLVLSADKAVLLLNQKYETADALVFSWTTGTNNGTNAAISYTLKIDKQGANFSNPVSVNLGNAILTQKYSVKDLNDSLLNHWKLSAGVETILEAKVISSIADNVAPGETSNTITIKVTPYKPVTTTLYIIGDAAPNGWNANTATAMTAVPGKPGSFTWQGNLYAGEFKFITTLGQFTPSYNKGAAANSLVFRTNDTQPDDKFSVSAGTYVVNVDLLNLAISIEVANTPPFNKLWIVGDATPNGWNINAPNQMRLDSSNPWVFTFNEVLAAGEFKIPTSTGNWGADFYMPLSNHPVLSETTVQFTPGGSPDNKWQISNPGPYKIRLDLQNKTINISPFTPYTKIWMVGDASPAGWNIDTPTPMTAVPGDPYTFQYIGPMKEGEFKFPLSTGNWGCDYFMPVISGSGPGSNQMKFIAAGNPDNKWKIPAGMAGNYKITIDQLRETISIEKQ
jgi:starch-binding outer membrane protein SusE/F